MILARFSNNFPRLLAVAAGLGFLIPQPLAQPAAGGRAPEAQKESDWVDDRWNHTDLGAFHASVVAMPGGAVAKGLSVRVGGAATMVYDTQTASLHGGWTGGFLKFSGARYGLIDAARPAGAIAFATPAGASWGAEPVRWDGLHTQGGRVVLDYRAGGVRISESPWFEQADGLEVFSRHFEFGPHSGQISMSALAWDDGGVVVETRDGFPTAIAGQGDNLLVAALVGGTNMVWTPGPRALRVAIQSSPQPAEVEIVWARLPASGVAKFFAWLKKRPATAPLAGLKKPGSARWSPIETRGQRSMADDAYVVDTLTMPYDNPWQALMFASGVDFLPDGRAVVCTIHGDVWLVSGIDAGLGKLTWTRFATGLFQPLGLKVRDGEIFVLGRDQITRLHDENADGEADFYENFHNGIHTSPGGHDYVTSLEKDDAGNLYYVDPDGAHRVSRDGQSHTLIASGWRNPNGMGVSPDGRVITVAPQQGTWTPSSVIAEVKPDGWYGFPGPRPAASRPLGYDLPLCWIPHRVDNSGGSQLWVTSGGWGPLQNQLLHFSFGRCAQFLVMREVVDGTPQAAVTRLPGRFLSGAMRGAFNPADGQLYVAGSTGWQTAAVRDGCLQRVRFTGANPLLPVAVHAHANGLRVQFTSGLDRAAAEDAGSYALSQWNYRYTEAYGSSDYSAAFPEKEGRDGVGIKSATLLPDGMTVFLEIPNLHPVMQWELQYSLNSTAGKAMRGQIDGTIHRLAPNWPLQ